jgi:hypothetical protein
MADLPIACTLSPSALKARRQGLLSALLRNASECAELPDGYASAATYAVVDLCHGRARGRCVRKRIQDGKGVDRSQVLRRRDAHASGRQAACVR